MYVCGATVQSEPHVGHGRYAVVFDVIRRYLQWRGFVVTYVRNITDIDDKIISAAAEAGESVDERAERISRIFADAYRDLGVDPPDVEPKATEHIPDMVDLISRLIERGLAYQGKNGDVYFAVRAFEEYGRLSGRHVDELLAGARVEVSPFKRDPLDFALWKAAKPGEPAWESPWGEGRPGWHIECSAMAARYLGEDFDIHGGGADLIFPHHENEIAQSEGATGQPFARFWLHNGMVNLSGEKMSKSTGRLIGLQEVIAAYGGPAVRLFYLRAHYRSPIEFSDSLLEDAAAAAERLGRTLERIGPAVDEPDPAAIAEFTAAMDDDFSTPEALGILFDALRESNRLLDAGEPAGSVGAVVVTMAEVLGLGVPETAAIDDLAVALAELGATFGVEEGDPVATLDGLVEAREAARSRKDFAAADAIRQGLAKVGVAIEDTPAGARWRRG
jgi:cysteinyl-tRNA synthetase